MIFQIQLHSIWLPFLCFVWIDKARYRHSRKNSTLLFPILPFTSGRQTKPKQSNSRRDFICVVDNIIYTILYVAESHTHTHSRTHAESWKKCGHRPLIPFYSVISCFTPFVSYVSSYCYSAFLFHYITAMCVTHFSPIHRRFMTFFGHSWHHSYKIAVNFINARLTKFRRRNFVCPHFRVVRLDVFLSVAY